MNPKEAAFEKISALVERFNEQSVSYKHSDYNETLTRRDFIDPFFKALGWDIDNESGNAEAYREVIHEDKIKIGSATKAPDYSFRLPGGKRLFFVEAKKPSVFVKEEIPPAYQIRRYGWSAKLPISIVTDFEEFAIYDCTKKPKATDKASTARIKYLNYKEYLTEFDFIWDTFSKERVLKGSFDKFVLSDTGKKGTTTVDKEFLESLNDWRKMLAETISINNVKLDEDEINFAVQQTLDRIIFLRICEDRGVEPYEKLKHCLNATAKEGVVYKNLFTYFEEADKKYNSGLFDLAKDNVSRRLYIDNKILTKIIEELYYPVSPYEFSVLSVEILGSAYEQFLGKVIRLTPSRKAKIEEKPEVRKAGGVYYTPQYIVDYIVKNTVGKLLEGKTPKEAEKIKIVDPACGSGSFLIGAYQYLLDWHLSYYMGSVTHLGASRHPTPEGNKSKALTPDGRLTTAEKKRILINNIYGVDIDTQATEVTKLSLLLKCMEGETLASVQQTMSFMHERILPTLENNIKSGNSLIDMDFYDGELEFSGTERKIKPFNWQSAFPEVFKQGGFDCVIGNPPYVNAKLLTELFYNEKDYLNSSQDYITLYQKWDLYIAFIEKGLNLLKNDGKLSMIIPYPFVNQLYAKEIRKLIVNKFDLYELSDLSGQKVFKDATVKNCIIFISNTKSQNSIQISKLLDNEFHPLYKKKNSELVKDVNTSIWATEKYAVNFKQKTNMHRLGELCFISKGMVLNADENKAAGKFRKQDLISQTKTILHIKKYVEGKYIDRYRVNVYKWLEWNTDRVPALISRPTFKELYEVPKILINKIGYIKATYDQDNLYCDQTIRIVVLWRDLGSVNNNSINNSIKRWFKVAKNDLVKNSLGYSYCYILAILNSKLGNRFLNDIRGVGNIDINPEYLKNIIIPRIDFTNPAEKKKHDEIVNHVETMLELNRELEKTKSAEQQERLKQRISYTDKKIDALVYELYGLTEEEIKVVEGE